MAKTGKSLFFLFLFLFCFVAEASVRVRSFADRKDMGMGDTIDVVVQVSSTESVEVSEPHLPDLKDFDLLNSSTSSSTSSKLIQGPNGMEFETQKQVEFHYMLTPKQPGTLTVGSFSVDVEGKAYKTEPFTLRVSKQGSGAAIPSRPGRGRGGALPDDEMIDEAEQMFNHLLQRQGRGSLPQAQVAPKNPNEAFFIHLDLDKKEVYEGEQITANWSLYSRGNIMALDRLKFPELKGFWKEIIEEVPSLNFTQEVINGVAYRKALLASHALFPIKPGVSVIDEYKVKATVQLPSSTMGVFGFGQPYTYSRSSDRVKITVKPLPTEGRPSDFSGAVGEFEVTARVEQQDVPLNQPFALKIRFEGEGNAKLIELPQLNLPAGVEAYDTKSDAKFFKNGRSYKEFEVLLIPREPGELKIPELSISMFDPKSGKYYSRKTGEILLKVVGEKTAAANGESIQTTKPNGAATAKKETVKKEPELPSMITEVSSGAAQSNWPWTILAGFSVLASIGTIWKAKKELGTKERRASIEMFLHKKMKDIRQLQNANQWREASVQTTNMISTVLGQIAGEAAASTEIRALLEKAPPSLRRDLGEQIEKAIETFQFLSFAPEGAIGDLKSKEKMQAQINEVEALLKKALSHAIDTQMKK